MKTYTQEELNLIVEKHGKWLRDEEGGERANLAGAKLARANLAGANLADANLAGANLARANLARAYLAGATGNSKNLKTIQTDVWTVTYTDTEMQIGCQKHLIESWWKFDDEEIESMSGSALEFWKKWKPILQAVIAASPAEPTGYVEKTETEAA